MFLSICNTEMADTVPAQPSFECLECRTSNDPPKHSAKDGSSCNHHMRTSTSTLQNYTKLIVWAFPGEEQIYHILEGVGVSSLCSGKTDRKARCSEFLGVVSGGLSLAMIVLWTKVPLDTGKVSPHSGGTGVLRGSLVNCLKDVHQPPFTSSTPSWIPYIESTRDFMCTKHEPLWWQ